MAERMTIPDLAVYLRARYDEEEAAAIAAGSPRGGVPTEPRWCVSSEDWDAALSDGCGVIVAPDGDGVAVTHGAHRAAHVATWDPARVLAEVAAKRAVLHLHRPVIREGSGTLRDVDPGPDACCASCGDQGCCGHEVEHPCPTLLALAQPYADRDDFPAEWRTP